MPSSAQIIVSYIVGVACGSAWVALGVILFVEKVIPPLRRSRR